MVLHCLCSASVEFSTSYAPHDPLRESEHKVSASVLFCKFVKRAENSSTCMLCDKLMGDRKMKDWDIALIVAFRSRGFFGLLKADFPQ